MSIMNLSIGTTFNYGIPLKDQLSMIKAAGFTHISLGASLEHSGYLDPVRRAELKQRLSENGLQICSLHAPFSRDMDISAPDPKAAQTSLDTMKRCLDAAADLDAGIVVFHPYMERVADDPRRKDILTKQVIAMFDHIADRNIRLAAENLRVETLNEILIHSLNIIRTPRYGLCYDSSHDNLTSQPMAILRRCGTRIITTHISDNRKVHDDHMLPFEGTYDWDHFTEAFSRIKFAGVFLLEVEMRESAFKDPVEFLKQAYERGKNLLERVGMGSGKLRCNPIDLK